MFEVIRSGYPIEGSRIFCEFDTERKIFIVGSRFQCYHKTCDMYEALVVLEGLCETEKQSKAEVKNLVTEARRNRRAAYITTAAWERRVLECARRRNEGLRPVICGSKGAIEKWVAK